MQTKVGTQREQTENEQRAKSQYARSLIEASLDPLVTISPEGKITDVNQATETVTGRGRAELIGTDFSDYFTEPDKAREGYQRVFLESSVVDYPLSLRHRDGHVTDVLYNASVYRNEAGEVLGVFAAARDVTERNKAEAALRESEALLQATIKILPVGLWVIDADGKIEFSNDAAKRIWAGVRYVGIEQLGEYKGWRVDNGRPVGPHEWAGARALEKCETSMEEEIEIECFDGTRKIILDSAVPLRNSDGSIRCAVTVNQDITERKRAEITLREQTEFLRAIFGSLLDAFVLIDSRGIIVDWSRQAEKIFGWIKEEAVGRVLHETIIPLRYREAHVRGMEHFLASGEGPLLNSLTETFALHHDGHEFPIELSIVPLKKGDGNEFIAFARDITDRKLNEAINASRLHLVQFSLTHSLDELLEETLNETEKLTGSAIGFYHFVEDDQNSLTLQNWSKSTKAVFCKAEGKGLHYPIDEAGVWVDCVRQGKAIIHNDYASLPNRKGMPEGHATVIRELVVPVFRGNKISAILGVGNKPSDYTEKDVATVSLIADLAWEIAERKKAEDKIYELNRDLERRVVERTAQLEASNQELEAFSYSVSHDLRTPLRAIDGFSHILLESYADKLDDEGKRLLNVVRDNTARMGKLIDDILKFSRTSRLEMTYAEIDMAGLACEVFKELQPTDSKLQIEIDPIPPTSGDRAMMHQVFVNLLSNAIKFSRQKEDARIKVGGFIEASEAVYFVSDNGVGFDMKYADKLFGVFQRLHSVEEFEGTGIGLAIVKRIIARHGGRVWAEGKLNEGTTIYFALPAKVAS